MLCYVSKGGGVGVLILLSVWFKIILIKRGLLVQKNNRLIGMGDRNNNNCCQMARHMVGWVLITPISQWTCEQDKKGHNYINVLFATMCGIKEQRTRLCDHVGGSTMLNSGR